MLSASTSGHSVARATLESLAWRDKPQLDCGGRGKRKKTFIRVFSFPGGPLLAFFGCFGSLCFVDVRPTGDGRDLWLSSARTRREAHI